MIWRWFVRRTQPHGPNRLLSVLAAMAWVTAGSAVLNYVGARFAPKWASDAARTGTEHSVPGWLGVAVVVGALAGSVLLAASAVWPRRRPAGSDDRWHGAVVSGLLAAVFVAVGLTAAMTSASPYRWSNLAVQMGILVAAPAMVRLVGAAPRRTPGRVPRADDEQHEVGSPAMGTKVVARGGRRWW